MADTQLAINPTREWRARFWSSTERVGDCLEWRKARIHTGYGVYCTKALKTGRRQEYAHRLAYALTTGPIPAGMNVCHTCDNPSCINPAHLFLGTQLDNMQDWKRKNPGHTRRIKITNEQVEQMKADYARGGVTFVDLGAQYGISYQHAHGVVRGNR